LLFGHGLSVKREGFNACTFVFHITGRHIAGAGCALAVAVVLQFDAQAFERIGAVVDIRDGFFPAQFAGFGVERRADGVLRTVLPVVGAGFSVPASGAFIVGFLVVSWDKKGGLSG
jgi:hypothetical protein